MPKLRIASESKLTTRSKFTMIDCVLSIEVSGQELPNMSVIGKALEEAEVAIQTSITESYAVVPERV